MKKFTFFIFLLCAGMNVLFAQIAAPTLNSPADGYVYPSTVKPNLKLNAVSGASYYLFHWSEDPTFATYSSYTMSSSYTGLNVNGLKFGTTYYWRVYAITANYADTSAASAVRSFTTTDAPTITAPADGTILTNSISPSIQWTEIVGATKYLYQCDTSMSFNSPLLKSYTTEYSSGGKYPLNLHFGKTYYLRMRATNTDESDTSAWSAVRSFTTSDSITLVSFNDTSSSANYFTRQTLTWKPYRGVTQYFLQLDTTPHFNSPVLQQINHTSSSTSTTDNQSVIINNMRYGSMYYWRVRAANYNGSDTSSWSSTWQFRTTDFVNNTDNTLNNSDSTRNYYTRQTLYWKNNKGSTKYILQLDTTPHFNSPILREIYTTNAIDNTTNELSTKVYNMLYGTMYYYRVCAINNAPDTSGWSATWQFHTIDTVFSTSNTLNNSDSTKNYYTRQILKWQNNRGSTKYILQLDTTPDFNSSILRQVITTNNIDNETNELSTTVYNLLYGTMYYYRVCAINNAPDTSGWSATWQFHTIDKVFSTSNTIHDTVPTKTYYTRQTLKWQNNRGSTKYILQLDTTPDFNSSVLRQVVISNGIDDETNELSTTVYNLLHGAMYYYRLCAINNAPDTSGWSDTWQFHTRDKVYLYSPADQTTNASPSATLQWKNSSGSSKYILQVDTSSGFNSSSLREIIVTSSITNNDDYKSYALSNLRFGDTYYWRVRSVNEAPDTSGWSDAWSFTVTSGVPTLTSPSDGVVYTACVGPTVNWASITGASHYILAWDTVSTFDSPLYDSFTTTGTSVNIWPIKFATTYYWRVCATNSNDSDTSAWSAAWTFTTSDAPILTSPSDGYVYPNSATPTLKCTAITRVGKYIYQWDTTATFNSPLCASTTKTSNSTSIGPLKLGTTYYWRMRATNYNDDSDTSSWSTVWSFTTGGSIPTLSSPSNGSTAVRLRPTLDWNAVSSCDYYDYECDTTPQFNSPELQSGAIAAGTSEVRLNQLRYGTTYYWRVRIRLNSDTSSWSTVWRFTTAGTIALTSPSNGSTLSRTIKPTLDWDYISDGDYYEYQYDLSPDFDSPALVNGEIAVGTSQIDITEPLRFGETYYWRVREYTAIDTTPWSETWSFNTPGEIALVSPSNGSTLSRTINTTLDWDYISGGLNYQYQYDLSPDFDSPALVNGEIAVGTSQIDITAPLQFGETYYWRVREYTAIDTTPWSETWSFNTPGEIVLVSPANGSTNVGASTTLDWDYIRGGSLYEYQYDTCATFDSPSLATGTIAVGTSQVSVTSLHFGTTYYWRVRETSPVDTTDWSAVWNFTTTNGVPVLTSPSDGYVYTNSVKATVYWNSVTGAGHYIVAWDTVPTFDSPLYETFTATASSIYITELNFGTTYYWKVCSINSNDSDTSSWSTVWRFTTSDAPVLTSPADGTAFSSYSNSRLTVYWNSVTGADHYILEWDTAATFNSPLFATFTASGASVYITEAELQYGTTYYWRVCAINSNAPDTSSWSTVWRFTTPYQLTTGPTLVSPANDSSDIDFQSVLALQWDTLANVNGYRYQVSTSSDFSTLFAQGTTAQTTASIHNLRPATTYYWRVQGYNGVGNSVWSAVWHFSTGGCTPIVTSFTHEICEGELPYHYINGDIDTTFEVGTPQLSTFNFQLLTPLGCDSTVTLHLTVHPAVTSTSSVTVCESELPYHYVDGDIDITFEVGTPNLSIFSFQFSTQYGCDSTVILTVNINQPVENETYMTACDEYEWNGETLTASGDYTATFTAANGCDSVVTLHLTINEPTESDTTATACGSFDWHGYTNLTESGDYTDVLENAEGCDSIVTLHLTINTPTESDTSATVCGSFNWHSYTNLTESGDYTDVLTNAAGCDSTVTLHLTINTPTEGDTTATACGSFNWHGYTNLTESGDYTDVIENAAGCDSTVTLHLTINTPTEGDTTATACGSFDWHGYTNLTESGDYTDVLTNAAGCDSTVTLHLTINQPVVNETHMTACDEYEWNGETLTSSGDYTATFTAANGCDSTVTLHLTIHPAVTELVEVTLCENDLPYHYVNGDIDTTFDVGTPNLSVFNFQFSTQYGCDSVVTLHLTINVADTTEFTETACGSYVWNDEVYEESGDYVQTFANANGCDSVVTLHLTVITINTEVLVTTTEELDAWSLEVMQEGAEYQWIDCETNETIEGEVHQRFNPAISGQYACVITMGECTDTTECIDVTISGIDDYADGILSLYPNPTTGMVNVQFTMNNVQLGAGEIQVLDVYGRVLDAVDISDARSASVQTVQIDLSHYATGVYFVRMVNGGKVMAVRKVVKE
ncbi:MAG: T9SS type A sorting domain-containing protein [Bacteroidales bacterium]|nr:T9SS type A sorting domain-containing protein [Bacteroidales bacterium]